MDQAQLEKLNSWAGSGGISVEATSCDMCGKHSKFIVEIEKKTWTVCVSCAKKLKVGVPLRVINAKTKQPTGRFITA